MKKLLFLFLFVCACESPEVGGEGCCWICRIQTTYYNPQPGISELKITVKFADSVYCDCSDEFIKNWEIVNSDTTIINGIKTVKIAVCKK